VRVHAPIGLLAAAALAGCGAASTSAGNFHGEQKTVAQVIDDLSSAAQSRDTAKICNTLLDPALAAKLKSPTGDCQQAIGHQLDDTDNFNVTVQSVLIGPAPGTTATARVKSTHSGKSTVNTLTLVKQGTSWHISGLGA
jgi:hypothetical protein